VGQLTQYYVAMRDDEAKKRRAAEKIERQLDEALKDTFPASDPVSIATSEDEVPGGADDAALPQERTKAR
jgi:hypothetical protein